MPILLYNNDNTIADYDILGVLHLFLIVFRLKYDVGQEVNTKYVNEILIRKYTWFHLFGLTLKFVNSRMRIVYLRHIQWNAFHIFSE